MSVQKSQTNINKTKMMFIKELVINKLMRYMQGQVSKKTMHIRQILSYQMTTQQVFKGSDHIKRSTLR